MWSVTTHGQNLAWAKQFGGTANNIGKSITVDNSGNIYTAGVFRGTADFDPGPGTYNLTTSGLDDIFITKLDVSGDLIWAKQFRGADNNQIFSIAVDDSGNVYTTGYFGGTADFDPGPGVFNLTSTFYFDAYVVKLNAFGNLIWAKRLGGADYDYGRSVAINNAGEVYVAGSFEGTADFDPGAGTFNLSSSGDEDAFIIKLDASGNFIWAKHFVGISNNEAHSAAVDAFGNVYITGNFQGTVDYDPGPGTFGLTALGTIDIFITKLDVFGNFIWAKQFGGVSTGGRGNSITVDASGNVYTTGFFRGTVDFDPGIGAFNLTSAGTPASNDIFISKLDAFGNLIWAKHFAGISGDEGHSLVVDTSGNVYAIGEFQGTADFDPGPGTFNLTSAGSSSIFITTLSASGNFIWARRFGETSVNVGYSIAVDASRNVYATGFFQDTADFDPGPGTFNLTSAGVADVFVLKLSQSISVPYIIQGNLFGDMNSNCIRDSSEIGLAGILIKVEPGTLYGMSNILGSFVIYLFDTGSYTISVVTQDSVWQSSCSTSYNLQVTSIPDTITGIDFAMRASYYCSRLTVELGTSILRRCFNNTYSIPYANTGTLPAPNVYVEVDFGNLQPQSSTLPWSTVSGNVYTFPIGNLNINQQGSFNVTALLDCNVPLGSTQCVTAHIYPDTICAAPSPSWDKSDMTVTGNCINDSLVCFTIWNNTGAGNMNGPAQYRLYINDTLMLTGNYQLASGDSSLLCYPANGKTYRLEADQRPNHPRNSHPQSIIEACGTNTSGGVDFGFVNTVAQDDEDLFVETFCMEVIGSYDPNDKQVFPTGITANKYIKPDDELEYLIRFQNTGNDTAFKVVIRDTIQTGVIDIATLTSGASSHDYTFNIYGHGIAEWTFDNILLPDSNVNEPGSNGFVQFKAKLLPNIAPGTIVTNSADIYFDFNAPVATNEVWNTMFDTVIRAPVTITGTVLTESSLPVPGVKVMLTGTSTDSVITAADGRFGFEVEAGGNYTVTPSKNNDTIVANGVTAYDILLMRRHLLAIGALPSPYKIIAAAEVNAEGDTVITTQDIVHLRSLILGNSTALPGNRLWQFVSSDYIFTDTTHPFPFNKTRSYTNIISNQSNQNFIGIKLGDVNGSWEE